MPHGEELRFTGVTKRFGAITAVDDLTAAVSPGAVTGFLGPNGAGKTTTLRMLLGLVAPTSGAATVGGVAYRELRDPLRTVGAALEASSFHPGRTGANHLRVAARAAGLPDARVDEVLGLVGLEGDAGRKVGSYSLGMRQRLGLAAAMLGDPGVLVLDEPVNGLDPEGIRWIRGLLQGLAREGRTVLVSSHLLAEVQQTADQLLVIAHGRLVYAGRIEDLLDPDDERTVFDGPDRAALASAMSAAAIPVEVLRSGLTARHVEPVVVGRAAAAAGAVLSSLQRRGPSLEEVFLGLVDGTRVHRPRERSDADEAVRALPTGTVPVPASEPDAAPEPASLPEPAEGPPAPAPDPTPVPEPVEGPPATVPARSFAVAATGVIDVVHDGSDAEGEPAPDSTADPQDDPGTGSGPDVDFAPDADVAPRSEPDTGVDEPSTGSGTDTDRDADPDTRDPEPDTGVDDRSTGSGTGAQSDPEPTWHPEPDPEPDPTDSIPSAAPPHDSALAAGRTDDEWEALLSAGDDDDRPGESAAADPSSPRSAVDGPIERVWTWEDADDVRDGEDRR